MTPPPGAWPLAPAYWPTCPRSLPRWNLSRLLEGAKQDLCNGWFFYERQTAGLGVRFLAAIKADVRLLTGYAGIHLQVDGHDRHLRNH